MCTAFLDRSTHFFPLSECLPSCPAAWLGRPLIPLLNPLFYFLPPSSLESRNPSPPSSNWAFDDFVHGSHFTNVKVLYAQHLIHSMLKEEYSQTPQCKKPTKCCINNEKYKHIATFKNVFFLGSLAPLSTPSSFSWMINWAASNHATTKKKKKKKKKKRRMMMGATGNKVESSLSRQPAKSSADSNGQIVDKTRTSSGYTKPSEIVC
jgi:hypothetical protein